MKRISVSVLALALTAVAGTAFASYQGYGNGSGYDSRHDPRYDQRYDQAYAGPRSDIAQVTHVQPIYDQRGAYQHQECWNEQANRYDGGYYRDSSGHLYRSNGSDSTANGTLLGALIGGALGNQVGKGDGRTAATIGGAVIGGVIGNNVDRNYDNGYDQYRDNAGVVRRCRTVTDNSHQVISGYDVTYRYAGQVYHAVTPYNPGRTMHVVVDVRPEDGNVAYRH